LHSSGRFSSNTVSISWKPGREIGACVEDIKNELSSEPTIKGDNYNYSAHMYGTLQMRQIAVLLLNRYCLLRTKKSRNQT
jgi:hypothetical protein